MRPAGLIVERSRSRVLQETRFKSIIEQAKISSIRDEESYDVYATAGRRTQNCHIAIATHFMRYRIAGVSNLVIGYLSPDGNASTPGELTLVRVAGANDQPMPA